MNQRTEMTAASCVPLAGVLVGGSSRRMGTPKALLAHPAGGTYVEHVVSIARRVATDVLLLGTPDYALPAGIANLPCLRDSIADAGPLAGLVELLERAGPTWTLLLSCDLPLLGVASLECLCQHADADAIAFRASAATDRLTPCCACYHGRILPVVQRRLHGVDRSMHGLLSEVRTVSIQPSAAMLRELTNVNDPSDRR